MKKVLRETGYRAVSVTKSLSGFGGNSVASVAIIASNSYGWLHFNWLFNRFYKGNDQYSSNTENFDEITLFGG